MSTLAIVQTHPHDPHPIDTSSPPDDVPDHVIKRMTSTETHLLAMAQAQERVVSRVRVPTPMPDAQRVLTAAMDSAITMRAIAGGLSRPLYQRRPVQPGEAWTQAETAAQSADQAYRLLLADSWPVHEWQDAMRLIARAAADEGAWQLLSVVGDGLEGGPGSESWWDAVVRVSGLWYR